MSTTGDQPNLLDHRIAHSVPLAIDWISHHFDHFSPFDDNDVYRASRTKPFTELAILFAVYVAASGDRASQVVRNAAQFFQAISKRDDFTDWILRFPEDIVNYAELCIAVHELGGNAGELRHRLQSAVDAGALSHAERLPHRLLELRTALDWAGVSHSLPSTADIWAQTMLGKDLLTPLLSDSAIYAITHTLIFGSRFGLEQDVLPESFRGPRIRRLLCDLLVVTSQTQNWDLLGELLLCWDCVGFTHDPLTTAAWGSFLEAFRADGTVLSRPTKRIDGEVKPRDTHAQEVDESSDFINVYHTTLVAVLAGIIFLGKKDPVQLRLTLHRPFSPTS